MGWLNIGLIWAGLITWLKFVSPHNKNPMGVSNRQVATLKSGSKAGSGPAAVWKKMEDVKAKRAGATVLTTDKLGTTSKRLLQTNQLIAMSKKQCYKVKYDQASVMLKGIYWLNMGWLNKVA